jgi:hypothetical protein
MEVLTAPGELLWNSVVTEYTGILHLAHRRCSVVIEDPARSGEIQVMPWLDTMSSMKACIPADQVQCGPVHLRTLCQHPKHTRSRSVSRSEEEEGKILQNRCLVPSLHFRSRKPQKQGPSSSSKPSKHFSTPHSYSRLLFLLLCCALELLLRFSSACIIRCSKELQP